MYVEPNFVILKRSVLIGTLVLLVLFGIWGLFSSSVAVSDEKNKEIFTISGILNSTKNGGFHVNATKLLPRPEFQQYVGSDVVVVGVEKNELNELKVEKIVVIPEDEPDEDDRERLVLATAPSDYGFSLRYPEDLSINQQSTREIGRLIIFNGQTSIDVKRAKADEGLIDFDFAQVSSESIEINGFSYDLKRVIPDSQNRLTEILVPSESCSKNKECPNFVAVLNGKQGGFFRSIISSVVFFPEPQGWKRLKQSVDGSKWSFYLWYPPEIEISGDSQSGYVFFDEGKDVARLEISERRPLPDVKSEEITLPTRTETLYHDTNPDGTKIDRMILRTPDNKRDIEISGFGVEFDALIRTFVFTK